MFLTLLTLPCTLLTSLADTYHNIVEHVASRVVAFFFIRGSDPAEDHDLHGLLRLEEGNGDLLVFDFDEEVLGEGDEV